MGKLVDGVQCYYRDGVLASAMGVSELDCPPRCGARVARRCSRAASHARARPQRRE